MTAFIIKKKPLFYKLGAKIFKWLRESNMVVEAERFGKVIESQKQKIRGQNLKHVWEDELNGGQIGT